MKAWVIDGIGEVCEGSRPLRAVELPEPAPGPGEVLLQVHACGVCHTELDEVEGRTPPPRFPMVPGHQVVGTVVALGPGAEPALLGTRVGVAWIGGACGVCPYCMEGRENLCPDFLATGRDVHGGYAERTIARADFVHPLPPTLGDAEAAPLLCAGAIGHRALKLTGLRDGQVLGLTGFGASGHQVLRLAKVLFPACRVMVFARSASERALALELGAAWAGDTAEAPPVPCQAIIDTTPAWRPVIAALEALAPGGRLVINAIRKEERDKQALLALDYAHGLWMEKEVRSVANLTRADVREFLILADRHRLLPRFTTHPFDQANEALIGLKLGRGEGAKVLVMDP
jgi:propanol-preferring alcohol dehydrogenase